MAAVFVSSQINTPYLGNYKALNLHLSVYLYFFGTIESTKVVVDSVPGVCGCRFQINPRNSNT